MNYDETTKDAVASLHSKFFVTLLGIFLLAIPWAYGLALFKDQLAAVVAISALLLVRLLSSMASPGLGFKSLSHIDLIILLTIPLAVLSAIFSSAFFVSLFSLLLYVGVVFSYFLFRSSVRSEAVFEGFLWISVLAGAAYSAYGLIQYFGFLPHSYWYQPDSLASRFVNGSHFAAFLMFPLFTAIGLCLTKRNLIALLFLALGIGIMGWALLLSRCRTVWLAFFLALLIFGVLISKQFKFSFKFLALGAVALLAIVAVGYFTNGFAIIGKRFYAIWSGQDTKFYSLIYRWELWQGCLAAIASRPLGWGIGSFKFIFPQFRVNEDRFVADYAHNELLHLGVDFGLPGILLAAVFIFLYARSCWALFHDPAVRREMKIIGASFVAVMIALAVACMTDFPLRIYGSGIFFFFFLAMSGYLFNSSEAVRRHCCWAPSGLPTGLPPWPGKVLPAAVGFFMLLSSGQLMAQNHAERGRRLEAAFQWAPSIAAYEKAVRWSRVHAPHYEKLADLYRKKMTLSMDRKQRSEMRTAAIRFYQKALEYNPYVSTDHYFLALLYEEEGEVGRAREAFRQAISKDPRNAFYVLEAGRYALRRKDVPGAVEAFERFKGFKLREIPNSEPCSLLKECMDLTSDYGQLKRIIPDQWMYHQCFGMLLAGRQQWEFAKLEFDQALAQGREGRSPEEFYRYIAVPIADFYASKNKVDEALGIYQALPAVGGSDADRAARIRDLMVRSNPKVMAGVPA